MNSALTRLIYQILFLALIQISAYAEFDPPKGNFLVGRGIADITGPALGVQMWGFGQPDQTTEGIHLRLKSRAFVISELDQQKRVAIVSADIGSIEYNVTLEVLDRLEQLYGKTYSIENVILSATHTHSGPGGYWHNRSESALSGNFHQAHFETVVAGIVESISMAHENLQPSLIRINQGEVEGVGINRSLVAYEENPQEERDRYSSNIDKEMTLLKFSTPEQDNSPERNIGMINWHAVHPTSMTYDNRLISSDHKGYASYAFEKQQNTMDPSVVPFVGAFAQANPGDVTSNLNLDNTGPGKDAFESTKIIAQRQLKIAQALFATAKKRVIGEIDYRQIFVDLSNFEVSTRYTGLKEVQRTCPSAFGYPFFGGSTEDGGGFFLFEEGMKGQSFFLDMLAKLFLDAPKFTDEDKACQAPKAILLQTGSTNPPLQTQIRSISLLRIGQLVILAVPAELTTMSGRRLRETVMKELGDWAETVVIAGYSNGYAGYATTAEEYRSQQYEGGHTLHGQWTLAAYQETARTLALAMEAGGIIQQHTTFEDWRGKTESVALQRDEPDYLPKSAHFGEYLPERLDPLTRGNAVTLKFWSSNPTANYDFKNDYMAVQQQLDGEWVNVYTDADWSTKIRWQEKSNAYIAHLTWVPPTEASSGIYRLKHFGRYTNATGKSVKFEGESVSLQLD